MIIPLIIILLLAPAYSMPYWSLEWLGEPGYEWDGVEPDYFDEDRHFVYRVRVNSPIEPLWVILNLDWNADGQFARSEQVPMKLQRRDSKGFVFEADIIFGNSLFSHPLSYYFSAQVGYSVKTSPLLLGPFCGQRVSFSLMGDTLWNMSGPVVPLELLINTEQNRFLLANTGNVPITFGLAIEPLQNSYWSPARCMDEIGENKFLLSGIFTEPFEGTAKAEWFNSFDWEDVITMVPRFAHQDIFGFGNNSAGVGVGIDDTIELCFSLVAPSSSGGGEDADLQTIRVRIFATSE